MVWWGRTSRGDVFKQRRSVCRLAAKPSGSNRHRKRIQPIASVFSNVDCLQRGVIYNVGSLGKDSDGALPPPTGRTVDFETNCDTEVVLVRFT